MIAVTLGPSWLAVGKTPTAERVKAACAARLTERLEKGERAQVGPAEVLEVLPGVFYLQFESQEELASTFLRFQEHYESPEFRGKVFSLDEYRAWYVSQKGAFTYYQDWSGFNIPSYVLEPFFEGKFDPLSEKEQRLLELFRPLRGRKFYVIGAFRKAPRGTVDPKEVKVVHHEVAHSLFYMDPEYRREVMEVLGTIPAGPIHQFLGGLAGYHPSVFDDETHAYLMTGEASLTRGGIDLAPYRDAMARLHRIFARRLARLRPGA